MSGGGVNPKSSNFIQFLLQIFCKLIIKRILGLLKHEALSLKPWTRNSEKHELLEKPPMSGAGLMLKVASGAQRRTVLLRCGVGVSKGFWDGRFRFPGQVLELYTGNPEHSHQS